MFCTALSKRWISTTKRSRDKDIQNMQNSYVGTAQWSAPERHTKTRESKTPQVSETSYIFFFFFLRLKRWPWEIDFFASNQGWCSNTVLFKCDGSCLSPRCNISMIPLKICTRVSHRATSTNWRLELILSFIEFLVKASTQRPLIWCLLHAWLPSKWSGNYMKSERWTKRAGI